MFKLNKSMFLTLKTGPVIIIAGSTVNYKYYKTAITAITIITYKLSFLIIIFNIIDSCLKLP